MAIAHKTDNRVSVQKARRCMPLGARPPRNICPLSLDYQVSLYTYTKFFVGDEMISMHNVIVKLTKSKKDWVCMLILGLFDEIGIVYENRSAILYFLFFF